MQVFGESLGLQPGIQARDAEDRGYDGIVAVDHFYSTRAPAQPKWRIEPLVALGAAAATTTRITLAAMVMNTNFHHPAVIAHAMASLDRISGGRAEAGLGSGWYAPEHTSFGLPWGDSADRLSRLVECAAICRAMFENRGVVSHHGRHFSLENPVPWEWEGKHPVPVVIGGAQLSLLRLGAEIANRIDVLHANVGGNPIIDESHSRSELALRNILDEIQDRAAGSGNPIKVSATLTATIVKHGESRSARLQLSPQLSSTESLLERDLLYVVGTQEELLDRIRALAALGVDRVHVIPGPIGAQETVAHLREMLRDIQLAGP